MKRLSVVNTLKKLFSYIIMVSLLVSVCSCSKISGQESSETGPGDDDIYTFEVYSIDENNKSGTPVIYEREYYSDILLPEEAETEYIDLDENLSRAGSSDSFKDKLGTVPADSVVIDAKNKEDAYSQIENALEKRAKKVYCSLDLNLNWVDIHSMNYGSFWLEKYWIKDVTAKGTGVFIAECYEFKYYDLTENDIKTMKSEIDKSASEIISHITVGLDAWNKAKAVHDELIELVTYDQSKELPHCHDLYGALVYHNAVCSAYASAYKFLLKKVGINSRIVSSDPTGGRTAGHAWNAVEINGIETYIDVTWDDYDFIGDNGKNYYGYEYFGLTQYEVQAVDQHMVDHIGYRASGEDPASLNYFVHENYQVSSLSEDILTDVFSRQHEAGYEVMKIRFTNNDDYQKAKSMAVSGELWGTIRNAGYCGNSFTYHYNDTLLTLHIFMGGYENSYYPSPELYCLVDRFCSAGLGGYGGPELKTSWIHRLNDGLDAGECVMQMFTSEELISRNLSDDKFVDALYLTAFGEAPDEETVSDLTDKLSSDYSREEIIEKLIDSELFESRYQV